MKTSALLVSVFVFYSESSPAQFQWGIGMNPGISKAKLEANDADLKLRPAFTFAPKIFAGYNWKGTYDLFFKVALMNGGVNSNHGLSATFSNFEFQWIGSVRQPISKNAKMKEAVGLAASTFDLTGNYNCRDNIYLVTQVGLQFVVPGNYHFLFLALDYHYGLREEFRFQRKSKTQSDNIIYGRGSYVAANMDIIFGKEKNIRMKKHKKKSGYRNKPAHHYVM